MLSECLAHRTTAGHRRISALILTAALFGSACASGGGESSTSVDTTVTTVSDRDEDFTVSDTESSLESTPVVSDTSIRGDRAAAVPDAELPVSITDIDFDAGTITIVNHGADDVDLGEVWLCEFPDYSQLDAAMLPAGETLTIANPHESSADSGELALYRSNDFASAEAILSYVEWGESGHRRSSVAVEADVWGTDAVDAGLFLTTGGIFAVDAADWSVLTTLSGEQRTAPSTPATTRAPATTRTPATTRAPTSGTTSPAPATTAVTVAPPDDYAPPAPAPSATSAPTAPPPPPDEY